MGLFNRDDSLLRMLSDAVTTLHEVTNAFHTVTLVSPAQRDAAIADVLAIEQRADELFEAILGKVGSAFTTPYDREDIYRLMDVLDDVADSVEHTCHLLVAYGIGLMPPAFAEQAADLTRMGDKAAHAVEEIRTPDALVNSWREVIALETAINARHRAIVASLLNDEGRDLREVIKLKDVADSVEVTADLIDQFVRMLVMIALKETRWAG